jgi:putative membrane protein
VTTSVSNRNVFLWSFLISGIIIGFLLWLIYIKGAPDQLSTATSFFPAVNAFLNGLSASFLITYVTYHNAHGDTPFQGAGFIRLIYFFILISHILLTTVALPLILVTFYFALTSKFDLHKKIARITLPAWLYVSVTGVVIFLLLKIFS